MADFPSSDMTAAANLRLLLQTDTVASLNMDFFPQNIASNTDFFPQTLAATSLPDMDFFTKLRWLITHSLMPPILHSTNVGDVTDVMTHHSDAVIAVLDNFLKQFQVGFKYSNTYLLIYCSIILPKYKTT